MKNLIILAHPDIENSLINKRFLKEAAAQNFEELIAIFLAALTGKNAAKYQLSCFV